jgi:hypothetical protein
MKGTTMSTLFEDLRDEFDMTRAWVANQAQALRAQDGDRGNNSVDNVVWIAAIALAAVAIAAVIVAKIRSKADEITLE